MLEAEADEVLNQQRQELDFLFNKARYAQIGRMEGIRIVQKRQERPDEDCAAFALGLKGQDLMRKVFEVLTYPEAKEGESGKFAIYFNSEGDFTHIGLVQESGLIVSKWDKSHVYEHPVFLIPASFGNIVKIVRDPLSKINE